MPKGGYRIEVDGLTKHYGTVAAVSGLDFTVEPGTVTGFLGPNGSGKTTTLRALLGLIRPTSGRATIGGRRYVELTAPSTVVGAALDAAHTHPAHSARTHLRVHCAMAGHPDRRADEVIDLLGMADYADRRSGGYSTGMRQRLNLATALLGDPRVLLLDEPANGLDPEGIAWLRDFLRGLAADGRTVLVSSHLLAEVQQSVDRAVIIHRGRLLAEGSLAELDPGGVGLESVFLRLTAGAPGTRGTAPRAEVSR